MRSRTKGAIVALVAVTAMLAIPSAQSLPGGIAGVQQAGCNCHGAVPSDTVVPSIEGLPESYNYSREPCVLPDSGVTNDDVLEEVCVGHDSPRRAN